MSSFPHQPRNECLHYTAPSSLSLTLSNNINECLERVAPLASATTVVPPLPPPLPVPVPAPVAASAGRPVLLTDSDSGDRCVLCLEPLGKLPCSQIKSCHHRFHTTCIRECLKRHPRCPICGKGTGAAPRGTCPSGVMKISASTQICPGFEKKCRTIQIDYSVPSSVQLWYHDNPGYRFKGANRTAFLPNNKQGQELLARLQFAWIHGLTFNVGTSLTTGQQDCVTWSSIHHKTSLHGGAYGFPDPNYIENCHKELTALGVPTSLGSSKPGRRKERIVYSAPQTFTKPDDLPHILKDITPSTMDVKASQQPPPPATMLPPPPPVVGSCSPAAVVPIAPLAPVEPPNLVEECPICLDDMNGAERTRIKKCSHSFHLSCLRDCLKNDSKCPVCRTSVGDGPRGKCPTGTMSIKVTDRPFPGYAPFIKVIDIVYSIPPGIQASYHQNPGLSFQGTKREAYLPSTEEGCALLTRLKYAWMHGLTFSVGRSLTTGQDNTVTWSSIPHKTSLHGGEHGFPDPRYVFNCNESLGALGVPEADDIA